MAVPSRGYLLGYEVVTKDSGFAKMRNRYNTGKNKSQIFGYCDAQWYFLFLGDPLEETAAASDSM